MPYIYLGVLEDVPHFDTSELQVWSLCSPSLSQAVLATSYITTSRDAPPRHGATYIIPSISYHTFLIFEYISNYFLYSHLLRRSRIYVFELTSSPQLTSSLISCFLENSVFTSISLRSRLPWHYVIVTLQLLSSIILRGYPSCSANYIIASPTHERPLTLMYISS
jgi:hypothetical protein